MAMALPVSAAIRAWLSDVGIPKYQAKTAHRTIEKSAAQRAIEAEASSSPKYTILDMVSVIEGFIIVIRLTPAKLSIADINTALFILIHLVVMHVATALGASVSPFTNITAKVRNTDKITDGGQYNMLIILLSLKDLSVYFIRK